MLTVTKDEAKQFEFCCGKQTTKHVNYYGQSMYIDEIEHKCMVCHNHKTINVIRDEKGYYRMKERLRLGIGIVKQDYWGTPKTTTL